MIRNLSIIIIYAQKELFYINCLKFKHQYFTEFEIKEEDLFSEKFFILFSEKFLI